MRIGLGLSALGASRLPARLSSLASRTIAAAFSGKGGAWRYGGYDHVA